ncbi:MAG: hypothetical protein WCK65_06770 [Rhodospirillaceae bacterium]
MLVTADWQLDDQTVEVLRLAVGRNDSLVKGLLREAMARAASITLDSASASAAERRLGDRILAVLHLALDQDDLDVAAHLERAFEAAMTRFGGPDAVENRDVPDGMAQAYERLDALRRRQFQL